MKVDKTFLTLTGHLLNKGIDYEAILTGKVVKVRLIDKLTGDIITTQKGENIEEALCLAVAVTLSRIPQTMEGLSIL